VLRVQQTKAIRNMRSMMNIEFEHDKELCLIGEKNSKEMPVNLQSPSKEIDESELQYEKLLK
jgi:hypothetical protein